MRIRSACKNIMRDYNVQILLRTLGYITEQTVMNKK